MLTTDRRANKLGEGGFGPGTPEYGRVIAVKQHSVTSNQGKSQFVAEIATMSAVQHYNLVKFYGCCIDGDKSLFVYEYLENKRLDQALFGNRSLMLNWSTRFKICLGIAGGLAYLHGESRHRIVHRDVNSSNILLDSNLIPKIADFGLAKLYGDKMTPVSTRIAGTIGYLAPEYAMRRHLTEKIDIFAFGVVALDIISGRPTVRPSISTVVAMISEVTDVSAEISRPVYLADWEFNDVSGLMSHIAVGTDSRFHDSSESTKNGGGRSASTSEWCSSSGTSKHQ
ncbi:Tyrosine-protein kinase [Trema orientale]|uniref:non-specific serine/threonine protein kinase n=1 Tax=Trema orientale TaxID=63057 RepID=A0A2P5CCP5_TREOI|nr:Tyrosine-protein kinase [Trema orientale]